MELYYAVGACSFVPHACLNHIGKAFIGKPISLKDQQQKSAEFLALNPYGQVPLLMDAGKALTQVVAICMYLDLQNPEAELMPNASDPMARAHAFATLLWLNNTVHPTFTRYFRKGNFATHAQAQDDVKATAAKTYREYMLKLDTMVAGKSTFLNKFSPIDAYILTLFRWAGFAAINPDDMPELKRFVQAVATLPAVSATIKTEGIELNTYRG